MKSKRLLQRLGVSVFGASALLLAPGCAAEVTSEENDAIESTDDAIIGGSVAIANSFPFHAYLYITHADGSTGSCGGALLNQRWVITAAHCVDEGIQGLYVFLGMHHLNPPPDGSSAASPDDFEQFRPVHPVTSANVVFHPNYTGPQSNPKHYDLALVKMNTAVSYTTKVKTIALAAAGASTSSPWSTYATGWGSTASQDPNATYAPSLKVAELPVRAASSCNNSTLIRDLFSDEICAGYAQNSNPFKGTCFGDSGGPFFRQSGSTRELLGVTSWGTLTCADYSVFAKINTTSNLNWVNATIAQ